MENMCQHELMEYIRSVNFAMIELALFLDTQPENDCASDAYQEYRKSFQKAVSLYEKKFEPLTIYGVKDDNYWTWGNEPWPWQKECD